MTDRSGPKIRRVKAREPGARFQRRGPGLTQVEAPDVTAPPFRREAHHQSLAVATGDHAADDQAFIDAVSDWGDA